MGYNSVLYFSHITISLIKINIWNYSQRKKTHHNDNCKSVMDPSKKDEHGKHHKCYRTPEVPDDSDGSRIWKKKSLAVPYTGMHRFHQFQICRF